MEHVVAEGGEIIRRVFVRMGEDVAVPDGELWTVVGYQVTCEGGGGAMVLVKVEKMPAGAR